MSKRSRIDYALFLLASDLVLTIVSLNLASRARLYLPLGARLTPKFVYLHPYIYLLVIVIWFLVFLFLSVYDPERTLRLIEEIQTLIPAIGAATLIFAGTLYLSFREVPRLLFGYFFIIDCIALMGFRILLRLAFKLMGRPRRNITRVLIVGAGSIGRSVAQTAKEYRWTGLTLVGYVDDDPRKQEQEVEGLPVLGTLDDATRVVQEQAIDEVIFALPLEAHERLANLVVELHRLPVQVKVVPGFFNLAFFQARIDTMGGIPLVSLRESAIEGFPRLMKRVFDLVLASLLLIISAPLMLVVILLIELDSPGPAIFKQERVGENCKPFMVYKFRTMFSDAHQRLPKVMKKGKGGQIVHKMPHDPRVTRVGRFLRRTSLDELPQLINVIRGEMSLVGPRPELPFLVDEYEPWQRKRFAVPPGMTGWWQISGRSQRMMHLHTEDDLYYIQNYSLLLDLQILWKTIGVVISGRGAY